MTTVLWSDRVMGSKPYICSANVWCSLNVYLWVLRSFPQHFWLVMSFNLSKLTSMLAMIIVFQPLLYTCVHTMPFKSSRTKLNYFPISSKNIFILNYLFKHNGSKIRPHETWGLIFDPFCLKPGIRFCWKLYFARDDLSSRDIQILSILQIVQELLEGIVFFCVM